MSDRGGEWRRATTQTTASEINASMRRACQPQLGQGGGGRDPFREAPKAAAEIREAIREAVRPFAAKANCKAIVTFDGKGGVDVAIEIRA